ncbi:Serine/arginine-rich splicing factor SR45a [Ananas comosus]|uniref:Serine/arginine-rich splicing factor SR45a n=1 Tax=Ananas comosus TaxID=4615 RepID=A0A199VG81_ANACO|nr:Serine/arginine-rich splicing factor SR45a [Ananas comosus]
MSQTKEVRYTSQSITPPPRGRSRSRSSSRSRGRSRSRHVDLDSRNPGNNLYVTGLSTRVTSSDLEKYFSKEGRVQECHVVLDPRTKESRGFAFVTMETVEDAKRCIKYLHRTVLEGRLISVEKAKRKRGRTPTPGKYCGLRDARAATHLTGLGKRSGLGKGAGGTVPARGTGTTVPARGTGKEAAGIGPCRRGPSLPTESKHEFVSPSSLVGCEDGNCFWIVMYWCGCRLT